MPKRGNNMDNKSDEQFMIMKSKIKSKKQDIEANKNDYYEKMMKLTEDLKSMISSTITSNMGQMNI